MTPQQAHDLLGLIGGEGAEEIEQAYQTRLTELDKKIAGTHDPAVATKLKARRLDLAEAHTFLLRQTMNSATGTSSTSDATTAPPQTFQAPSGLSATMMADLPGAHPYQTALGTGGNMAQIASLQPGHVLANRFEIKAQIGAGGMGAVYRAHDRNRSEDIAVKVMLPGLISSDQAKQRFLNEAKVSIKLSNQNIVNVYDVQIDGAYIFITMELLEGTNLRQLMTEKKNQHQQWSESEVLDIIRPLCEALTYAHRFTIHRDIKPENVWINRDGSIKLMDFGIARLMTDSQMTQTSAVLGTAYYMAPEQLTGAKGVDHRADQYSVGVMVYELLTERIPTGRFKQINEIRDDISQGLSDAVDKALAGHPEDRYESMAAFAEGLQAGGKAKKKSVNKSNQPNALITASQNAISNMQKTASDGVTTVEQIKSGKLKWPWVIAVIALVWLWYPYAINTGGSQTGEPAPAPIVAEVVPKQKPQAADQIKMPTDQEVPGSIASINKLLKTGIRFKITDEDKTLVAYKKNLKLSLSNCMLKQTYSVTYENVGETPAASAFTQIQESINLRQVDVSKLADEPFETEGFHGEKSTWTVFVRCRNDVKCAKNLGDGEKKDVILITDIDNQSMATLVAAELVKVVKACVN